MKDRKHYLNQIINNIKAIEQINAKEDKPWNYGLKGLGKHSVNKAYTTADNRRLDHIYEDLNHLNKKIDKLNPQSSNPDFDKHPIMYTIDDCFGAFILVALIIGGIIAIGLFFHLALN